MWCRYRIRWKKCKKTQAKKVFREKKQKNGALNFNYRVQQFSAYNFFMVNCKNF
jgi:hypothetical protein